MELVENRLVWIMGSSRSGSTWLLRMLAELDGVVPIDDPHIGHHLGLWRPIPLAWAAASEYPELTTLRALKRDKPGYFFSDRYAETWRPLLKQLIAERFAEQAARRARCREAFIRWQASVWAYRVRCVAEAYRDHDPSRRLLVKYEQLLADPVDALRRICGAAGVNSDRRQLERIASTHDIDAVPAHQRGPDRSVRRGRSGGWRLSLGADEQRAMLEEMGSELVRFGYLPPPLERAA